MKKALTTLCLLVILTSPQAQQKGKPNQNLSNQELAMQYLKKSRKQNTTAWCFLVGGAGLLASGVAISMNSHDAPGFNIPVGGILMAMVGGVLMIFSIPEFISASKNKHRAEILLRNEPLPTGLNRQKIMSVGIAIALTR